MKLWQESYSSLLDRNRSGLPTLLRRRQQIRLILMYTFYMKVIEFPTALERREMRYEHRRASPPSPLVRKEDGTQAYVQFCSAGGIPPAPIRLQYFKWTTHTHLTPATCEFCILTERRDQHPL